MGSVYLSTAYLGPVQQYCKLLQYPDVYFETAENYLKQTYRNRCVIAGANGPLSLSIPIEKPDSLKCLTRDIRISEHGNWHHLHWNAILSAYNTSPFFEYYQDDFIPFYEQTFDFLFDFNEQLRQLICDLLDIHPTVHFTETYQVDTAHDFRESIRPRNPLEDASFSPTPYYQVFREKHGFLPNLSIIDLLFNMGPEGILVLNNSIAG
ncbi:hypothetical protein M2459_001809 [Parabacteroides sp. PF5-5]|uniref:WbqC family protein n=1 Tax=unclassified Parabacteroides TaxID=2649774 RepID=UPI0024758101|nr:MULTISPECIES: WbqC family protein [unclassified Parabacteroides]MDH6305072.1 hypothetical protein [Parabacteroides sp. PH5-39]MDH6315843.1 hypothetical protein [Parabacteroides sp. PF5-13]MDH6319500.1 hypothetical protein [Parabacteroides sp. PH5-13]MDH6323231.1 hypothetical protein [Parabacteroides sp. PH5-8]MDH6327261.1 hypothetical protein [Parabacteroides sp. PH5-41]